MSRTITTEVYVDISEFSDEDIIEGACDVIAKEKVDTDLLHNILECLIKRLNKKRLSDLDYRRLKWFVADINGEGSKSLEEQLKEEMMKEFMAKYSLVELTQKLK